jgi:hypothetical protein
MPAAPVPRSGASPPSRHASRIPVPVPVPVPVPGIDDHAPRGTFLPGEVVFIELFGT